MGAAVVYYSKTGHSKKIAQAIGDELGIPAAEIREGIPAADLLFVVGGIYAGKSAPEMLEGLAAADPERVGRAALVTSSLDKQGSQPMVRSALEARGIPVVKEEFACLGGFLFFARKRPNAQDIADAVAYARRVLSDHALNLGRSEPVR